MKKYLAEVGIRKLITLILAELDKKQDKMDEITAEEVHAMWEATAVPEMGLG